MNKKINQGLSVAIAVMLILSCKNDKETHQTSDMNGRLVSHSICKVLVSGTGFLEFADSLSCVEYSYHAAEEKLLLKHINAGFNCCPDSLYSHISVSNDTIIVREYEYLQNCYCNCLYDLDFEIDGVSSQQYVIRFIEPYCNNQEEIIFGVDFKNATEGSYCVTRFLNPWGIMF